MAKRVTGAKIPKMSRPKSDHELFSTLTYLFSLIFFKKRSNHKQFKLTEPTFEKKIFLGKFGLKMAQNCSFWGFSQYSIGKIF